MFRDTSVGDSLEPLTVGIKGEIFVEPNRQIDAFNRAVSFLKEKGITPTVWMLSTVDLVE